MKTSEQSKTDLITLPTPPPEALCERRMTAKFEAGGGVYLTVEGDSLLLIIREIINATKGIVWNEHRECLEFSLSHFQLTEADLVASTTEIGASGFWEVGQTLSPLLHKMISNTRPKFIAALAKQGIVLTGELGSLPDAL